MPIKSSTIPGKVYKYFHTQDVWIETSLRNRAIELEWLSINDNGRILVKGSHEKGYAWDGCSPKFNWLDLLWGTPDGRLDPRTAKSISYYASMIHDALYQYKKVVPVSRKEADIIFRKILSESKFLWAPVYGFGVRVGGGMYGDWKVRSSQRNIEIGKSSWLDPAQNHDPQAIKKHIATLAN